MPLEQTSEDRINIIGEVTAADLKRLLLAPAGATIQFDQPIQSGSFDLLEREFFAHRPDATFRVYGHYGRAADLSFLRRMPSVARFWANCLATARGVEHLAQLPDLRELWIGIDDLTDFDFLERLPPGIEILGLEGTQSRRPSIAAVSRFQSLRHLTLDGHHKGLDSVGELAQLEALTLWHYSSPDLAFLKRLASLRKLELNLGGGLDYSAIGQAPALEELHLTWIRRLADLSFLSHMSTLQFLMLDRMAQVRRLPDLSALTRLRRLTITQVKNLESAAPISTAPALEELRYYERSRPVADFERVLEAPSLRRVSARLGRGKRRQAFAEVAARRGIEANLD